MYTHIYITAHICTYILYLYNQHLPAKNIFRHIFNINWPKSPCIFSPSRFAFALKTTKQFQQVLLLVHCPGKRLANVLHLERNTKTWPRSPYHIYHFSSHIYHFSSHLYWADPWHQLGSTVSTGIAGVWLPAVDGAWQSHILSWAQNQPEPGDRWRKSKKT